MLVTSVHDPDVFDGKRMADDLYKGLVCDHAMHLAHCHILVVDEENRIGAALKDRLQELAKSQPPSRVFQLLSAALTGARLIRRPINRDAYDALAGMVPGDITPTTATALALSDGPEIDATLVSADGKAALDLAERGHSRVFTLQSYACSDAKQREFDSMGGASLNRMSQKDFVDRIIEPFVRWSSKITLIDRYVCKARFDWDPRSREPDKFNWPFFQRTIKCLYDTWAERCRARKDTFEVVTRPNRNWGEEWQRTWCEQGFPGDVQRQAQLLGESLGLGQGGVVRLVQTRDRDPHRDLTDLEHDRYLVSNLDHVLNFTSGFDLIKPNGSLTECQVFLQRNAGAASRMLTARDLGVWRYEPQ